MSPSVLDRVFSSLRQSELTQYQSQVDHLVSDFVEHATDGKSLAAVMSGGVAYRFGRVGMMSFNGAWRALPLRTLSTAAGLVTEVSAFETANRLLVRPPNFWQWDGPNGIRQGFVSSLVTFGSLKGLGALAQGQNLVVQHLFQSSGMVLGHQISGALGILPRPKGTLSEQFLHAEATNLQLASGMSLVHLSFPKLVSFERGIEWTLPSHENKFGMGWKNTFSLPSLRYVGEGIVQGSLKNEKEAPAAKSQYILSSRDKNDQEGIHSPLSEKDRSRIIGSVENGEMGEQNVNDLKEVISHLSPPQRHSMALELAEFLKDREDYKVMKAAARRLEEIIPHLTEEDRFSLARILFKKMEGDAFEIAFILINRIIPLLSSEDRHAWDVELKGNFRSSPDSYRNLGLAEVLIPHLSFKDQKEWAFLILDLVDVNRKNPELHFDILETFISHLTVDDLTELSLALRRIRPVKIRDLAEGLHGKFGSLLPPEKIQGLAEQLWQRRDQILGRDDVVLLAEVVFHLPPEDQANWALRFESLLERDNKRIQEAATWALSDFAPLLPADMKKNMVSRLRIRMEDPQNPIKEDLARLIRFIETGKFD